MINLHKATNGDVLHERGLPAQEIGEENKLIHGSEHISFV